MRRFRLSVAGCALAAALLAYVSNPARIVAQPAVGAESDRTNAELAKLYDAVTAAIEKNFFDESLLKRIDWQARARDARPAVVSAPTPQVAVRLINGLLAELKTSHTALLTPDDYDYYALLDVVGVGNRTAGGNLPSRLF